MDKFIEEKLREFEKDVLQQLKGGREVNAQEETTVAEIGYLFSQALSDAIKYGKWKYIPKI